MPRKLDLLTASMGLGVASYVAIILDCVARDELGLSDGKICRAAVSSALLVALALCAGSMRKSAGKTK